MAQLKDLVVTGASRLIGDVAANKIQTTTIVAPTAAGGASYGPGSNGQILVSNGSSVYWNNGVLSAGSAGYAASAAQATHAASANYSMSAAQATHSASSQYAINAASAQYARNAASAGYSASAAQATHAASAQYAISSASAGYAASAAQATHAASAQYAISSASAGYAASAAQATHAASAQYAINAASAQYARNAASAQYARNAASAGYATSAANATYAASAGSTTEAVHAVTAEYAASAGYALTADTSVSSGSAGYAASAAQATHAASAQYAISAASAGYSASAAQATHAASAGYSVSAAQATHAASADYAIQAGTLKRKIFYGTCNTASATTAKVVTCPEFTADDFVKGATVYVTFDYTNSGAVGSITMNVNGTGAKNIKELRNGGINNIPGASYIQTGMTYPFHYNGTNWVTVMDYDNNDVNISRITYPRLKTGAIGIGRYTLFMEASDGTYQSLTSTFNSTSANHAKNTAKFKLDRVYYRNASTDLAANNTANTDNNWQDSQTSLIDVRYSTDCIGSLTARSPFFIVGTVGDDGYFTLADNWYSTAWPTSDDGKVYIYIGHVYNDGTPYRATFEEKNPAYIYKNGGIQLYSGYALYSGSAVNASSAGYAASAAQATHAASAQYAIAAASAGYAASAAQATHAASAQYAIAAASAGYAASAAQATHAASANYSASAAQATHAASANYSMSAGRATYAAQAAITTTAGAVTYYSDTAGTFASDADFLWDATNNKLTAAKLNGYVMAGQVSGSTLGTAATVEGLNNVACATASHAEGESTTASGYASHAEGCKTKATSHYTHAEGWQTTASATAGHAEGWASQASGIAAHGEGKSGHASGAYSHAEGMETWATGTASHAEGASAHASGHSSHAEGPTEAKGNYSHSEGYGFMISGQHQAVATGEGSHIEGALCQAHGFAAHAEGYYTIAQSKSQHVFGEFNTIDPIGTTATRGQYVEIVGNGTAANARSNIRTLDWNGNQWLAGGISAAKFIGTTTAAYGSILPEDGVEGQIFFQVSSGDIYEIPVGGTTGQALIKSSSADRAVTWGDVGGKQVPDTVKFYPSGSTSTTANIDDAVFNTNVYVQSNVLYGACWNDYAEFRQLRENIPIPYGYCVCENGDDTLSLSTERMQPAPAIVSDTFGYAIGVTDKAQVPIAVSGRVLVYPYENRDNYKPGDCVCAGPEGKVCIMTREEIKEYPDRIVGIVSAIPQYTIWGQNDIAVDNRIWVKVK